MIQFNKIDTNFSNNDRRDFKRFKAFEFLNRGKIPYKNKNASDGLKTALKTILERPLIDTYA